MMKLAIPLGSALAALLAGTAAAQQADTLPVFDLEGVVVTVTRSPVVRAELPQRVDVVTRTEIERTPAVDAAELLRRNVAVDIIQYPGLLAGVSVRGFRPEFSGLNRRTAVLIDGRPAGTANLALLDPGSIERVEVLRGPASALHGSGAMAGAINLVTRRSTGPLSGAIEAAYGSFATSELRASVGGRIGERVEVDVGLSRFDRAENYRIGSGNLLRGLVGRDHATKLHWDGSEERVADIGDGVVRENSRYQTLSGNARVGVRLHPALRLETRADFFRADEAEIPGDLHHGTATDLIKDVGRRTGEISLGADLPGNSAMLRLYAAEEDGAYHATWSEEPFVSYVDRALHAGAQLQNVARFGAHTLTGGVDVASASTRSEVFSAAAVRAAPYAPDWDVRSEAAFGEARLRVRGGLIATVGGRLDRLTLALRETPYRADVVPAEESFSSFNPSAGARYELGGGVRLHGTAGRAFVAPNAFQRAGVAFPGLGTGQTSVTLGNPALRPESSFTWDAGLGLTRAGGALEVEATYFRTRLRDRISTAFAAFAPAERPVTAAGDEIASIITYTNAAEAEMRGVEWQIAFRLPWLAHAATPRLFARGTHMLRADELSPAVWLDSQALAGKPFDAAAVLAAIRVGDAATEGEIRNVATRTMVFGAELEGERGWFARLGGRYAGERLDTDFSDWENISDIRYPPSMTLDLSLGARLAGRYRVGLEVENLTDENVYEVRGYSLPGRQIRLRLGAAL